MPFFSDQFIEQVRAASDIVDVIGSSLPLKRAGTNFVTLCPFHKEKSPSFNVNPGRGIFHCFGCHKGGDVFRFVQDYENIGFAEAVERLAERARIPLEYEKDPAAAQARGQRDQLLRLHDALCTRWQSCLATEAAGQVARDYLDRRGVSADAVREFRLGAAPESWDDTVNWARSKGFDQALCEQAGLVVRNAESGRVYDRFRGRLMFPICDEQGRVIAFSGRILQGDEKSAKYVNSPETPLFTKGRVLFALDKARRAIIDAGHAIVCEGQLDTIACHAAGVRNVVAPQGTALTADHARILKRYTDQVVLCFDGDGAGQKAAVRALDDCLGSGLSIRVASIPPPDDPDSYIKAHGADAFRNILSGATEYFDFYLQLLCATHDPRSDRGRVAITREMAEKLQRTGSPVMIETYAQKTAVRLALSADTLRSEFRRAQGAAPRPADEESFDEPSGTPELPRPSSQELWLVKFLCLAEAPLLEWAVGHLDPNWITHPTARRVIEARLHQAGGGGGNLELGGLIAGLEEDDAARRLVTEAAAEVRSVPNLEVQLKDATRRFRDAWIERQIAILAVRLADTGLPDEQRLAALGHQQQLRAAKRLPLTPLADC
ncbi:MAG: DNA primase [Verrucomicrobia bacterium]|nr:MAG: DNA primase [Verrucomicrobiota bacterium]